MATKDIPTILKKWFMRGGDLYRIVPAKKGQRVLVFDNSEKEKGDDGKYTRVRAIETNWNDEEGYYYYKNKERGGSYFVPAIYIRRSKDPKIMKVRKDNGARAIRNWLKNPDKVIVPKYTNHNSPRFWEIQDVLIPDDILEAYKKFINEPIGKNIKVKKVECDGDLLKEIEKLKEKISDAMEEAKELAIGNYKQRIFETARELGENPEMKRLEDKLHWSVEFSSITWYNVEEEEEEEIDARDDDEDELREEIVDKLFEIFGNNKTFEYRNLGIIPEWLIPKT